MLAAEVPQPSEQQHGNDPDMALAHALYMAVNGGRRMATPPGALQQQQRAFFPGAELPASRSGRRPAPLQQPSTTSAVKPMLASSSGGRSKSLNSMAAALMAAATGQTVDQLQMQEFDFDAEEEERAVTAERLPTPQHLQQGSEISAQEEAPLAVLEAAPSRSHLGTPVPREIRREIQGGARRKPRTARQLAAAVASTAHQLTSHAMHLSRELKVR